MNKVFLGTYWVMWGEHEGRVPLIDRAWFLQTAPPYYHGDGISIRFGKKSLRFGICYPQAHMNDHDIDHKVDKEIFDAVALREVPDVDEKEIGQWGSSSATPPPAGAQ